MSTYDLSEWPLFRSVIDEASVDRDKSKTCRVLCPDNDPRPDVRRHAETVWKYIIRPGLLDSDFATSRAGVRDNGPLHSDADINELLGDDLVIAVLSYRNPDVFYQVAIAQAAGRPLILMVETGQDIPFDPRGALVVPYSVDTDFILGAGGVKSLNAAIRKFSGPDAPSTSGFRHKSGIPNNSALETSAIVFDRSSQFTYDQRMDMIRDAALRIDVFGCENAALALHPDMADFVKSRSGHDLQVRILQSSPNNPALPALLGSADFERLKLLRAEIQAACEAWKQMSEIDGLNLSFAVRCAQEALPLASGVITERAVVATPHLISRATNDSPTIYAKSGSAFHGVMQAEFDRLWGAAATFARTDKRANSPLLEAANSNQASAGGTAAPTSPGTGLTSMLSSNPRSWTYKDR